LLFALLFSHVSLVTQLRTSCTRGHPYELFKHHSSISVRSNVFAESVINAWNGLPADRIDFSSYHSKVHYNIVF